MNVQELIDQLEKVSNKSQQVYTLTENNVLCGIVLKALQSKYGIVLQLSKDTYGED